MTFDPKSVEVTCVTLLKDHCVQVPWKYVKVCGYSVLFYKHLNQRSLTPRWPLTPSLLRSHVWLYSRIIVSKSHENTSKYVDTVNFFINLNQMSLTPRWPLTPHLLRSNVWLYLRITVSKSIHQCMLSKSIHQCMWIQVINFRKKLPHTYILRTYIHTYINGTYYYYIHVLHTEWVTT